MEFIKFAVRDFFRIKYIFLKEKLKIKNLKTIEETLNFIIENKASISRFGDGEFLWIMEKKINSFQIPSKKLAESLKFVLRTEEKNHLVAVMNSFNDLTDLDIEGKKFWKYILGRFGIKWKKYLLENKTYYNANISRFYIDSKKDEESLRKSEFRFNLIKKIWENREVVVIEGEKTRFGVGNDLLRNCKSIKRILAPSENAFEKYESILNAVLKYNKDNLILVALGPTATILAYDLYKLGYQAIDIGHIDLEYEWFLIGAQKQKPIRGKYVNEVSEHFKEEFNDKELKQYKLEIKEIV